MKNVFQALLRKKQALLSILILIVIGLLFWSQSRYPALSQKLSSGDRTVFEGIAFDILWFLDSDSYFIKIAASLVNWVYTNLKGMTFGVAFGAAVMTILNFITIPTGRNRLIDSLKGILIGTPLGLCVNCSTPVGAAFLKGSKNPQIALGSTLSSPTLNIVVLTLLFTLFPFEFAVAKVAINLFILMLFIPLVPRKALTTLSPKELPSEPSSWLSAAKNVIMSYLNQFFFLCKKTVPLMFLAGAIGSVIVTAVPLSSFIQLSSDSWWEHTWIAIIGILLPVPVAFDVIVAHSLWKAGLSEGLALTLVVCLGSFSIYPLLVYWRPLGKKIVLGLMASITSVSIAGGALFSQYHQIKTQEAIELATESLGGSTPPSDTIQKLLSLCDGVEQHEFTVECRNTAIRKLASIAYDSDLCFLSSNVNDCKFEVAISKAQFNLEHCNTLGDQERITQCFKEALIRSAARSYSGTRKLCKQYGENEESEKFCRVMLSFAKAVAQKDVANCEETDNEFLIKKCKDSIRSKVATQSLRLELCENVEDLSTSTLCIRRILERTSTHDVKVCETLSGTTLKKICETEVIILTARRNLSPDQCSRLGEHKFRCKSQTLAETIVRNSLLLNLDNVPEIRSREEKATTHESTSKRANPKSKGVEICHSKGNIVVECFPHRKRQGKSGGGFSKVAAPSVGLPENVFFEFPLFYIKGGGIAAGDFDNDSFPDLAITMGNGDLHLYRNETPEKGRLSFVEVSLREPLKSIELLDFFLVSFLDFDNDSWPDLFFTTFGGRNFILRNQQGSFQRSKLIPFPGSARTLTRAAAFGDLDKNGELDFIFGNWSTDIPPFGYPTTQNEIIFNRDLRRIPIANSIGETLTVLLSDINFDGNLDLFVGNDYDIPDQFYLGDGSGNFTQITTDHKLFPTTTQFTMSIDSADFNNDLKLDIFSSDMSFSASPRGLYCSLITDPVNQKKCSENFDAFGKAKNSNIQHCFKISNEKNQANCLIYVIKNLARRLSDPLLCDRIPAGQLTERSDCLYSIQRIGYTHPKTPANSLKQISRNVLLRNQSNTQFENVAESFGVDKSFWSWNSQFMDVDLDGWLDIYVANTGISSGDMHSNVLFWNQGGRGFLKKEDEFGLVDKLDTTSYVAADLDLDGDLDLISHHYNAPLGVFVNYGSTNNGVSFEFRDTIGNRLGIGNKVIIHYGNRAGLSQIREIKIGGGYASFAPPIAYFGLGEHEKIEAIEVFWSTGEHTKIKSDFKANQRYIVHRKKRASSSR